MNRFLGCALCLALVAGLACKKAEPPPPAPAPAPVAVATPEPPPPTPSVPTVTTVSLGTAVDADKRVAAPVDVFATGDTIYASVETAGAGPTKLRAHWSFVRGDQTATVDDTTIELAGPGVSEFHIAKPTGWPTGDYKVDIYIGDQTTPALTKTFRVG